MNIVLSRKGFDASEGGIPSPILPDGRLFSLPIPHRPERTTLATTYAHLDVFGHSAAKILSDLGPSRSWAEVKAHLDPDLRAGTVPRAPGWRPLFGQDAAAQGHLNENKVGVGDLFLFFAWFRQTQWQRGRLTYAPKAQDLHVIFGWLEVGEIWSIGRDRTAVPGYAQGHPHAVTEYGPSNTIYAAASDSTAGARSRYRAGAFERFAPQLRLTARGRTRSVWSLPAWFYPAPLKPPLTYHRDPKRWQLTDGRVILKTVAKGQEFVLDTDHYPEARSWVESILATAAP